MSWSEDLAVRISQTWPKSVPVDVWAEDIADLDEGAAGAAFVRLRREVTHAPTIGEFRRMARSLNTHDASTRESCGWCANGWVETQAHEARGQVYSGWQPCTRCADGRANEVSEVWTKSADRTFVSEAEAQRLMMANRWSRPKPIQPDLPGRPNEQETNQ